MGNRPRVGADRDLDALLVEAPEWMLLEPPDRLGLGVAGRRRVQLDTLFSDGGQDLGIFLRPDPVTQTTGSHRDRLAHALRTGRLAGVDRDVEAQRSRESKGIFVQDGRVSSLVPGKVKADHPFADE